VEGDDAARVRVGRLRARRDLPRQVRAHAVPRVRVLPAGERHRLLRVRRAAVPPDARAEGEDSDNVL
jgi:hypothetical protein